MTRQLDGPDGPSDTNERGGDTPALDESTASEYLADPEAPLRTELGEIATIRSTEGAV